MTSQSDLSDTITPLSVEEQAAALWTFVHIKVQRFTYQAALEAVKGLAPQPDELPKQLAKRLRRELEKSGIAIKHSDALHAAARLLGCEGWHAAVDLNARLKLSIVGPNATEELVSTWSDLSPKLCAACDEFLDDRPARIIQVRFGAAYMMLSALVREKQNQEAPETWPLLVVNPHGAQADWLDGAAQALERLRRYLEQSARAVLDGVAVLQLCDDHRARPGFAWPEARVSDVCNSELILFRADHDFENGFEIARGDEMTCWYQLQLAMKDGELEIEVDEEDGAWRAGSARYVWRLSTLRPNEIVPSLTVHEFGSDYSGTLFKRYNIARRIFSGRLVHHEQTKTLEYLARPPETYRVDLHRLLLAMSNVGLTWENYCAEVGEEVRMAPQLNVGFVLALLQRLNLSDPNVVFARPTRSELVKLEDDALLRALLPRIDFVRYRLCSGLASEVMDAVRTAVEEFATSVRMQKLQAGGHFIDPKNPLPYLVYAGDGEELRAKIEEQGLVIYAGVMPHLFSTKGVLQARENMWPFAVGYSLYLDIDLPD